MSNVCTHDKPMDSQSAAMYRTEFIISIAFLSPGEKNGTERDKTNKYTRRSEKEQHKNYIRKNTHLKFKLNLSNICPML